MTPQIAVADPVDCCGGPRRLLWRTPQIAVADPVDCCGGSRRLLWRTPQIAVADPVDCCGGPRRLLWRTPQIAVADPVDCCGGPRRLLWRTPQIAVADPMLKTPTCQLFKLKVLIIVKYTGSKHYFRSIIQKQYCSLISLPIFIWKMSFHMRVFHLLNSDEESEYNQCLLDIEGLDTTEYTWNHKAISSFMGSNKHSSDAQEFILMCC